jgi:pectinesterase
MSSSRNCLLRVILTVSAAFVTTSLLAQNIDVFVDPSVSAPDAAHFPTVQMALDHAPDVSPTGRLILHIAPGVYRERVSVSQLRPRTTFLGTGKGPADVVITAAQYAKISGGTFFSETVQIDGDSFQADNVTFENSAGAVGQAVAIFVNADRAVFKHCRFLGDQDTLLANHGRQFYTDSYIRGGVDFIFGNAAAVVDHSEIHIIRPGYLTAQSRTAADQSTGYVIDHSRVTADDLGEKTFYLGRPWRAYARVVFMHTELPASLNPAGWAPWPVNTPDPGATTFYGEYANSGPGANTSSRVPWSHQLTAEQAAPFAAERFLTGPDHWDPVADAAKLP